MKVNKKRAAAGEGMQFFRPWQEGACNFSAREARIAVAKLTESRYNNWEET